MEDTFLVNYYYNPYMQYKSHGRAITKGVLATIGVIGIGGAYDYLTRNRNDNPIVENIDNTDRIDDIEEIEVVEDKNVNTDIVKEEVFKHEDFMYRLNFLELNKPYKIPIGISLYLILLYIISINHEASFNDF